MKLKLSGRIALAFGIVMGLLVIGQSSIFVIRLSSLLEDLMTRSATATVAARAAETGRWLGGHAAQVRLLSTVPDFRTGDLATGGEFLKKNAENINPEHLLNLYATGSGAYLSQTGAGGSIADRDYFIDVVGNGHASAIGAANVSKSTGKQQVVLSHEVRKDDGSPAGIVAASISLDAINAIVGGISLAEGGQGMIFQKDGTVIAHPVEEFRMKLNVLDSEAAGFSGLNEIGFRALSGEAGSGLFTAPGGTRTLLFYAPVPDSPGWVLGATVPVSSFFAFTRTILAIAVVLTLVILAAVVCTSFIVARSITVPVVFVTGAARNMAGGDLSSRLDPGTVGRYIARGDEVGDLTSALNTLCEQLRVVTGGIKKAADEVASGSQQLSSTSQQMSEGAAQQASSVEENFGLHGADDLEHQAEFRERSDDRKASRRSLRLSPAKEETRS